LTSEERNEEKDRLATQVNTLIVITGLVMVPLVYLWQQSLAILNGYMPQWSEYLTSQLGSNYTSVDVIRIYFTPYTLSKALPIDLMIWAYDATFVLTVVTIFIFGVALNRIKTHEARTVEILVQRGITYFHVLLVSIIFFSIFHLLNTLLFPIKLLLGPADLWGEIGIALTSAIIVWTLLTRSIHKIFDQEKPNSLQVSRTRNA
jgi:hypothetical protein